LHIPQIAQEGRDVTASPHAEKKGSSARGVGIALAGCLTALAPEALERVGACGKLENVAAKALFAKLRACNAEAEAFTGLGAQFRREPWDAWVDLVWEHAVGLVLETAKLVPFLGQCPGA
jgi:hypothetical protein